MKILGIKMESFKVKRRFVPRMLPMDDLDRAISALESPHKDKENLDAAVGYAVCVLKQVKKRGEMNAAARPTIDDLIRRIVEDAVSHLEDR